MAHGHAVAGGRINIFVSIPPQKYLLERIGGDQVIVNSMVQPGHSPETYDPTTNQLVSLGRSRLYFRIGVPFEKVWIQAIKSANKDLKIIEYSKEISLRYMEDTKHGHVTGGHAGYDPHVWTSPENAKILAAQFRDELIQAEPAFGRYYEANYQLLISDLDELDRFIFSAFSGARKSSFIVSHDSWGYYADRYGLQQIAVESGGREKGPRGLAGLIDLAKRERIDTLFVQKQFRSSMFRTLARELDAKLLEIDPMAENYIDNLRTVTTLIAGSLNR